MLTLVGSAWTWRTHMIQACNAHHNKSLEEFAAAANAWAREFGHEVIENALTIYRDSMKKRQPEIARHFRLYIAHILGLRCIEPPPPDTKRSSAINVVNIKDEVAAARRKPLFVRSMPQRRSAR
jgi:hypothetical protein